MTNETNRTKTKVGRIGSRGMGTRTLAIVLGLVMLLTAIGSGSVLSAIAVEGNGASVLLDAAKAGASVDVAADVAAADDKAAADEDEAPLTKKADSDLADTGRDADVADTGANITVYFYNTLGWENVYAYNPGGWNESKGVSNSGDVYIGTNVSGKLWSFSMTNTDGNRVAFSKDSQPNFNNLYNTEACYREDLAANSIFVPKTTLKGTWNGTKYYSSGAWVSYEYWVIGHQFDSNWNTNAKNCKMTLITTGDNPVFYYTKSAISSNSNFYRFHNGSEEYGPTADTVIGAEGTDHKKDVSDITSSGDKKAYSCPIDDGAGLTVYFDPVDMKTWVDETPTRYYIFGNDNSWSRANGYQLVSKGNNVYEANVTLTKEKEFKVWKNDNTYLGPTSQGSYWVSDYGDISLNTTGQNMLWKLPTGSYKLSFNSSTNKLSIIPEYSLWGGEKKELNATVHITNLTKNTTTGLYDGTITLANTNWYSLKPSASTSTSTFSQVWNSYNEVAWALNTYNSNTVYKNYSNWHREPSSGNMSSGILNYVETTDYSGGAWGIKIQAKTAGTVVNVSFDPTTKIIYLYGASSDVTKVDVYAKDGAAPINWDSKTNPGATGLDGITKDGSKQYLYNYAIIADTTITSTDTSASFSDGDCTISGYGISNSGSTYRYGQVAGGKNITVTTTIDSKYSSRYYVAGWCVNGVTYMNGTNTIGVNSSTTDNYSFTYTIPADTDSLPKDVNKKPVIEITPIYYLKSPDTAVTFYLEGYSDVEAKWGNTPYVYPFYGNLSGYQNTFGVYPGQPMVNVNGQYSTQIPINTTAIDTSKQPATTKVKGITISNGYADHVHRNLVYGWTTGTDVNDDKDHMQTYDYDDFDKIYEERLDSNSKHPNAIFFRIKEETNKYNRSTYGGGSTGGQFASGTSDINISTIGSSGNGWELMKDRHDRPVNIFGDYTKVTASNVDNAVTDASQSQAIYVVSTGYNANIAGDYGTMWKVYDSTGKLITKNGGRVGIPPSLLNFGGTASGWSPKGTYTSASHSVDGVGSYTDANSNYLDNYKALKATDYENKLVYITYEKDTQDTRKVATGTGAYRLDGKWYYTHASDSVQSVIGIEYYNRTTGTWDTDTVSSVGYGSTTHATAKFSNNSKTSSSVLISSNSSWDFDATEEGVNGSTTYEFAGWFIKYDDTYDPITGATTTGSITATANYNLIARYVPVANNTLTITHRIDPTSTGTGKAEMTVTYNGASQTVSYVNGVARANIPVTYTATAHNFSLTLTTTPYNDGVVTDYSYDSKVEYASNTGDTVPGSESAAVTRTLTFTNKDLYASDATTQKITELDYSAKIDATPHYYEFTYTFKDRGGDTKNYTARGEISEDQYAEYVNSSHEVSDAFVKSRAPFESNFLKTLKLDGTITKGYTTGTHTLTASATYNATPNTPVYDVKIKLPYNYRTEAATESGVEYKKYNANGSDYYENQLPFTLKANYDEFVTIGATETKAGAQTKVSKVVDVAADPNHTGNDFITAPNTLTSGSTTYYFKYWEIKRLADNDSAQSSAPVVSRVYFPDFNYRIYCDSYVEAVYTTTEADYWANVKAGNTYSDITCSVLYLESSRNQWNMMNGTTSTAATDATAAADKIYNDFIFNYNYKGKENLTSSDVEIGMVLERVYTGTGSSRAWVKGSSNVTDMDSYRTSDAIATENKTAIADWLKNGGTAPAGCVKQEWGTQYLNNKNYTEQPYSVYSAYGQTVADHSISFATPSTVDEYVYRAWAYIKDKNNDGAVTVSDPAYFSMAFIASANYSE